MKPADLSRSAVIALIDRARTPGVSSRSLAAESGLAQGYTAGLLAWVGVLTREGLLTPVDASLTAPEGAGAAEDPSKRPERVYEPPSVAAPTAPTPAPSAPPSTTPPAAPATPEAHAPRAFDFAGCLRSALAVNTPLG